MVSSLPVGKIDAALFCVSANTPQDLALEAMIHNFLKNNEKPFRIFLVLFTLLISLAGIAALAHVLL